MTNRMPLDVLRVPGESNPYQSLSIAGLEERGVRTTTVGYTDPRLSLGFWTHDIVHIDWLDGFVRRSRSRTERLRAQTFLALTLLGAVVMRRPVFWTLHNTQPHGGGGRAWRVWKRVLSRVATDTIVLSPAAADHANVIGLKGSVVESGFGSFLSTHPPVERDVARAHWVPSGEPIVLVHFGQIREQKGIVDVLAAMREIEGDDVRLIVAGNPAGHCLSERLADAELNDSRLTVLPRYLNDDELGSLLSAADIALMPFHGSLTTSSAHIAAEHGVAIVAPDVRVFRPYGSRYLYRPEDGAEGLAETLGLAVCDARSGCLASPSFKSATWNEMVEPVALAYQRAVDRPFWRRF